jgi:phage-related minor tail protein
VPFAYGGVVNKPTLFPMANGAGLMGEAGPEAIMPLRRTASGRLGVESSGGVGNVVVNVDATGSSVQGDQPSAEQLGRAIGQAVQAELIKQKRPGGLLTR